MSNLGQSGEDYLETILVLGNCNGEVRSVDIAREMNVTKPSVCRAVGLLKNGGFIRVDDNGYITFTDDGRKAAESVYERHTVLTDWLIGIGISLLHCPILRLRTRFLSVWGQDMRSGLCSPAEVRIL